MTMMSFADMVDHDPQVLFTYLFVVFWFVRYFRLLVNVVAFATFKPRHAADKPKYTDKDITILMPTTFSVPQEVTKCLQRMQSCGPAAIIVITSFDKLGFVKTTCEAAGLDDLIFKGVTRLNKRRQMLTGLEHVKTPITFFVDDDVYYASRNLPQHLLNCFDDAKVGAAGPRMRAHRASKPSFWNFLGISYLERRNFNTGATNHIDGGIPTLSGRTQAIRTSILRNNEFWHYFRNDSFLGRKLTVDDDKALTRFLFSLGWKIALNFHDECTLETTLDDGWGFVNQCVRWARGHWRGNLIVMAKERYWFTTHLWTLWAIYACQFQTPALLIDGVLLWALHGAVAGLDTDTQIRCYALFAAWVALTKIVKLIPHFVRYPQDLIFIPASILFSYVHGAINLYALFTTHQTIWGGSRIAGKGPRASIDCPEDSYWPVGLPDKASRPTDAEFARVERKVRFARLD